MHDAGVKSPLIRGGVAYLGTILMSAAEKHCAASITDSRLCGGRERNKVAEIANIRDRTRTS